jgi:hypothetical protein
MKGPTAIFLQYIPRFQYIRKSLLDKPKKHENKCFVFLKKTFNNLVYFLNHDMITKGATTLSIMTLSITTFSITMLCIMTLSIMTISITTFNITINKSRHSA